jgi:hypothetical protein
MTSPKDVMPYWEYGVAAGVVTSAYARFTLDCPIADPSGGPNVITLDVNPDDGRFRWSAYFDAGEGAPFNEGEIKWGSATDLEGAKRESWAEAYRFLISLDYTDTEIAKARPRPAGSLELDLDNDDDE